MLAMSTDGAERTRPSRDRGKPKLSKVEKRAQATLMMMERLFGGPDATLARIGEKYHMDPRTVQRRLRQARTDGVPEQARDIFIREMLPQSMAVLQDALTGDDLRLATMVALKVVEGLKAMEAPPPELAEGVEETLEVWKQTRVTLRRSAPPEGASPEGDIIDTPALPPHDPEHPGEDPS